MRVFHNAKSGSGGSAHARKKPAVSNGDVGLTWKQLGLVLGSVASCIGIAAAVHANWVVPSIMRAASEEMDKKIQLHRAEPLHEGAVSQREWKLIQGQREREWQIVMDKLENIESELIRLRESRKQ